MVEFVTEGEEKITVKVENETEAELARDEVIRRAAIKLGEALGVACMECGIQPENLLTRPSARARVTGQSWSASLKRAWKIRSRPAIQYPLRARRLPVLPDRKTE